MMRMWRIAVMALTVTTGLAGCVFVARPATSLEAPPVTLGGIAYHSMQWRVRVTALPPGVSVLTLHASLQQAIDEVEDTLTTWRDSELMRFNLAPVGEWRPVSPLLMQSLQVAADVSRLSGGAYDVTVGPLVELWGFGATPAPVITPTAEAVATARARVDWTRIELDVPHGRARRTSDVRIDLSSLGEGAGVDAMVAVLERAGIHDYLASVAGTSLQRGQRPGGGAWALAIEPLDATGQSGRTLLAANSAVSTSGAYRNVRVLGGHTYSHTLDPVTGYPVTHDGVSVTLVLPAKEGATRTDALTTALNVLGPERGLALAEREGFAVRYVESHEGHFRERWSTAFKPYLGN